MNKGLLTATKLGSPLKSVLHSVEIKYETVEIENENSRSRIMEAMRLTDSYPLC